MKRLVLTSVFFVGICITWFAQGTDDGTEESVRSRLKQYVDAFNSRDAAAVVAFWTEDAVSVQEETGERTSGRQALLEEFTQFFDDYPNANLQGNTENVQLVGSDVAIADGRVTLFTDGDSVAETLFTAVL
ncbi:MAG: SgcJ/EcaC family oxidoreductase [Pirellulales bacterium]